MHASNLWDVMMKDAPLSMRAGQVEADRQRSQPVLEVWQATVPCDFPHCAAGTWGTGEHPRTAGTGPSPAAADRIAESSESPAARQTRNQIAARPKGSFMG